MFYYLTACYDNTTKFHSRDDLLRNKVVNIRQFDKIPDAVKNFKAKVKYLTPEDLQKSTILPNFFRDIGMGIPTWDPKAPKRSLAIMNQWMGKVGPASKFILFHVAANRNDMTKSIKAVMKSKLHKFNG